MQSENGRRRRRTLHSEAELLPFIRREYLCACRRRDLARKERLRDLLDSIPDRRSEQEILDDTLSRYCPNAPEETKRLICAGEEAAEWASRPYKASDFNPDGRRLRTSRGLLVRSKSEVIIAELLYSNGIPFRYEQEIQVDGLRYAPDFTILRSDGSTIFWEHMGLVSDLKYYDRQLSKLRIYFAAGIVPWKNLIISFDDERGLLDAGTIRGLIDMWKLRLAR